MTEQVSLSAEERTKYGKSANKTLRKEGIIPGVVYGGKEDPKKISCCILHEKHHCIGITPSNAGFTGSCAGGSLKEPFGTGRARVLLSSG